MDSSAYLKRHGWRGDGHSLDRSDRGIRKPLLVSKKIDVLGLGVNKHAAVADQWWMRAFDQGLKNFGTGKESTLGSVKKHGLHHGGLYGRFVKGEGVPGTLGEKGWSSCVPDETQSAILADSGIDIPNTSCGKKRKRGVVTREQELGSNSQHAGNPKMKKRQQEKSLPEAKLAEYCERAKQKGLTIDEYIKRRQKKYAEKKDGKSNAPP